MPGAQGELPQKQGNTHPPRRQQQRCGGKQAGQTAALTQHGKAEHRNQHCSAGEHRAGKFLSQPRCKRPEAQQQRQCAQTEAKHTQPTPEGTSAGQRQQQHTLQRAAGHKAVQEANAEGGQPLWPPEFHFQTGQFRQPRQKGKHIQPHNQHCRTGQQFQRSLEAIAQAANAPQQPTQRTKDDTQADIGNHPPQLIVQHGSKGCFFHPCQTLAQTDAAAHGNAVNRGKQPCHKQHSIAHGVICQLGGNQRVQQAEPFHHKVQPPQCSQRCRQLPQRAPRQSGGRAIARCFHRFAELLRGHFGRFKEHLRLPSGKIYPGGKYPRLLFQRLLHPFGAKGAGHALQIEGDCLFFIHGIATHFPLLITYLLSRL